jgi:hypothetical protein
VGEEDDRAPLGRVARRLVDVQRQGDRIARCADGLPVGHVGGDLDVGEDLFHVPATGRDVGHDRIRRRAGPGDRDRDADHPQKTHRDRSDGDRSRPAEPAIAAAPTPHRTCHTSPIRPRRRGTPIPSFVRSSIAGALCSVRLARR